MGLLKAAIATTTVRVSLRDIEGEARATVAQAEHEAARIVAEARERAGEIGAAAMNEGFTHGFAQGRDEARREATDQYAEEIRLAVEAFLRAAATIESSRAELETAAVADVVRLALAVAARITRRQGIVDPGVLAANLREAVKLTVRRENLAVTIHPSQRKTLNEALAQLKLEWPALGAVKIEEDCGVAPGGCRVTCGQGMIDADLDAQLDRLAAKLIPFDDNGRTAK